MATTKPAPSRSQEVGQAGVAYRQRLIDRMIQAVGKRASDAVKLSPAEELQRWMQPTSDAAKLALQRGGTPADAETANALSAQHARDQQAQMTQQMQMQGAKSEDVFAALQQAGLTDDQILQQHRAYAHALGKSNGFGSPEKEVDYHKNMAERAAAYRANQPQIVTLTGQEGQNGSASLG